MQMVSQLRSIFLVISKTLKIFKMDVSTAITISIDHRYLSLFISLHHRLRTDRTSICITIQVQIGHPPVRKRRNKCCWCTLMSDLYVIFGVDTIWLSQPLYLSIINCNQLGPVKQAIKVICAQPNLICRERGRERKRE